MNLELQQSSQNQVDSSSIFNGIEGAEMSNKGKDQGVVVNNVKTGTPAAQIGLKKGDVIIGANQQAVKNIAELRKVLDSKPSVLALNIQRGDSTIYLLMQYLPQPLPEYGKGFSLQSVNFATTPYIFIILWAFAQCRTLRTSLC